MATRRSIDASSVLSADDLSEYDMMSDGQRSLESSIADLMERAYEDIREPPPSDAAKQQFLTPTFSAEDIQVYVQRFTGGTSLARPDKTIRVYVDGLFDPFNVSSALQLRQAKLSFANVHLMVGVFADELCDQYGHSATIPHVERCELVRHCRWVDEVVPDAPWRIDDVFIRALRIDYVAIDEGSSIDPACDKERVRGFDFVKSIRKAIPTRRTIGIQPTLSACGPAASTPSTRHSTLRGVPSELSETETIKGSPIPAPHIPRETAEIDGDDGNPFEEPKVDEFGTGMGI